MGFELRGGSQLGPLVRASDSEWVLMYPAVNGTLSAETARLHCSAPRLQSCSNPPVPTAVAQEPRRSLVDCKPSVAGGSRRDAPGASPHTETHPPMSQAPFQGVLCQPIASALHQHSPHLTRSSIRLLQGIGTPHALHFGSAFACGCTQAHTTRHVDKGARLIYGVAYR